MSLPMTNPGLFGTSNNGAGVLAGFGVSLPGFSNPSSQKPEPEPEPTGPKSPHHLFNIPVYPKKGSIELIVLKAFKAKDAVKAGKYESLLEAFYAGMILNHSENARVCILDMADAKLNDVYDTNVLSYRFKRPQFEL